MKIIHLIGLIVSLLLFNTCKTDEPMRNSFTLSTSVLPSDAGKITPSGGTFDNVKSIILLAEPNKNWKFERWEGDLTGNTNPISLEMSSDKNVTAIFLVSPATYNLSASVSPIEGGKITPSDGTYSEGAFVTISATPNENWKFQRWEGDLSGSTNPATLEMSSNKVVTAIFSYTPSNLIKTYGGTTYDRGESIIQTTDGGYLVAGYSSSSNGDFLGMNKGLEDAFFLRLSSTGEKQWVSNFGGQGGDFAFSAIATADGGYLLTGYTNSNDGDFNGLNKGISNIVVIKVNFTGGKEWIKTFGGSGVDKGESIAQSSDGGYVITGTTTSNNGDFLGLNKGNEDIFILKLNSLGEKQWVNVFGGGTYDGGWGVIPSNDGGFIVTGLSTSNDGDFTGMNLGFDDIFILKLNSFGVKQWIKNFGGTSQEGCNSITQSSDGGYLLTGYTNSNDGDFASLSKGNWDTFIMKLGSTGVKQWVKVYGGSGTGFNGVDFGNSIVQLVDGDYIITGYSSSTNGDFEGILNKGKDDIFVMSLTSSGEKKWIRTYGGQGDDKGNSIIISSDRKYIITGYTQSIDGDFSSLYKGGTDIFVIKFD